jgi:hypothetical protein
MLRTSIHLALVVMTLACGRTSLFEDDGPWPTASSSQEPPSDSEASDASLALDASSTGDARIAADALGTSDATFAFDGEKSEGDSSGISSDGSTSPTDAGVVGADAGCVESEFTGDAASLDLTTACLGGGNSFLWSGGNATFHGGTVFIRGQTGWQIMPTNDPGQDPFSLFVDEIETRPPLCTNYYFVTFSAGSGATLAPGTYTNARNEAFAQGHPILTVQRNGNTCHSITGQFEILEMKSAPGANGGVVMTLLTATFEQYCDGATTPSVGCIHFTQ